MTTVREVLQPFIDSAEVDWGAVEAALIAREDNMADVIRLAGAQFGAFPELVAEVVAETGLGTPPTVEERAMLHSQFHQRMAWLQEEFRRQQGGGGEGSDI